MNWLANEEPRMYKASAIAFLVFFLLNTVLITIRMACYRKVCSLATVVFVITSVILLSISGALTISLTNA